MSCRYPMWAVQPMNCEDDQRPKFICSAIDNDGKALKRIALRRREKLIQLPCGKCIECRLAKSREWADRCILESKNYKFNHFLTLTYDNEHLPTQQGVNLETGELSEVGTLRPKDLQDFMKRLRIHYKRKYNHEGIKFYACGEYGEKRERPHYHAIIFNLPIFDLKPDHTSKKGNMNYYSEELEEIWGHGIVAVGEVTWESCAYTARYIMKKQLGKGREEYYQQIGREEEFVRMSRRPGIARDYYENNKEAIYECDEIFIKTAKGIKKAKPSRYYDKLFDIENPEQLREVKQKRKVAGDLVQKQKERSSDMTRVELWEKDIMLKDLSLKQLKRNFEK